jgi:hypothetical protein
VKPKPLDPDALRRAFAELLARIAYLEVAAGLFVDEADLETRKGDPTVHFVPNGWRGEEMKGKRFSLCPPQFLDHLAGALRSMAARPPKDPAKDYRAKNLEDAALARTWARVLRRRSATEALRKAAAEAASEAEFLT